MIGYQWTDGGKVQVYRRAVDEVGVHGFGLIKTSVWLFSGHQVIGMATRFLMMKESSIDTDSMRPGVSILSSQINHHWVGCRAGNLWRRNMDATSEWVHFGNYEEIYSLIPDQDNLLAVTRLGVVLFRPNGDIERFDKDTGLNNSDISLSLSANMVVCGLLAPMASQVCQKAFVDWSRSRPGAKSDSLVRELKDNLLLRELQTIPQSLLLGGTDLVWTERETLKRIGILELAEGERAWLACENPVDESLWVSTTSELLQISETTAGSLSSEHSHRERSIRDKSYRVNRIPFGRANGCTAYQSDVSHGVCFAARGSLVH